jgi:hypothetical protein
MSVKKTLLLSAQDRNTFKDDVEMLTDIASKKMDDMFNKLNINLTEIIYDSENKVSSFDGKTKITFITQPVNNIKVVATIKISELGAGYKAPSRRDFSATLVFKGISDVLVAELDEKLKLKTMITLYHVDGEIDMKMKTIVTQLSTEIDKVLRAIKVLSCFTF